MSQQGIFNTGSGPLPPASPPGYGQVYNVAFQNIVNGTTVTFDSNGPLLNISHVAGSNTITINAAGTYLICWYLSANSGDGGPIALLQNGVKVTNMSVDSDANAPLMSASGIINAAAGDTIQLRNDAGFDIPLDATPGYSNASITFEKIPSGGASSGTNTLVGNTGSATQVASIINVVTANSTPIFSGAGNTLTLNFGLTNLNIGSTMPAVTTGHGNTAIGDGALPLITTGNFNDAHGFGTLSALTTGSDNVAFGSGALFNLVSGSSNIAIGFDAGNALTTNESSNIYIGNAGIVGESNHIRIGTDGNGLGQQNTTVIAGDVSSVRSFTATAGNITAAAGDVVITAGNLQITAATNAAGTQGLVSFLGSGAANRLISMRGTGNTFVGYQSGNTTLTTVSAIGNSGFGLQALQALTTGSGNVAVGQAAGTAITTGTNNVAIGLDALEFLTIGSDNTCIGAAAGQSLTNQLHNVGIGVSALGNANGNWNIGIGDSAGSTIIGSSNICLNNSGTNESNTLRIGAGTNAGNQGLVAAYICGIDGVNVGSVAKVVTMASDQLGTATITAGSGISVTPGANTITIANTSMGLAWTVETVNLTATVNHGIIANKAGTLVITLPAVCAIGDVIRVTGINTALGWQIQCGAGQQIFVGNGSTTVAGTITSTAIRDSIEIVCVATNLTFNAISWVGNLTLA